jgi:hypothetical protein
VKEQANLHFIIIIKIKLLSNILRENINFNVRQLSHTVRHKAHGHVAHVFGLRVKAMLLAQCKLF